MGEKFLNPLNSDSLKVEKSISFHSAFMLSEAVSCSENPVWRGLADAGAAWMFGQVGL